MNDSVSTNGCTANEAMQQKWETFAKRHDTLLRTLHQCQEALARFSNNENIMRIRAERSGIIDEIRQYQVRLQDIQRNVRRAVQLVERRQEAAAKPQIITDIQRRIFWAPHLIETLKLVGGMGRKIREGNQLLAADKRLLEDYRGSLPEAEAQLQRLREEEQRCVHHMYERQEKADALREQVRALERKARSAVQEVQSQLQEHYTTVLQWAAQNRAQLNWFIQLQPHRRNEAVSLFRKLNPKEDVSDFVTKTSSSIPTPPPKNRKRNRVATSEEKEEQEVKTLDVTLPWVLILTTTNQTRDYILPQESIDQQRALQKLLKNMKCSAKASLVLSAIARVTKATPQQRTSLFDRVLYAEPQGWLIIHAGEFRILCDIDDQKRIIRFCVRPRRDAYAQ